LLLLPWPAAFKEAVSDDRPAWRTASSLRCADKTKIF
jgi:hypothetical protein